MHKDITNFLDGIIRVPDTSCVEECDGNPTNSNTGFHYITCCTSNIRDNRSLTLRRKMNS